MSGAGAHPPRGRHLLLDLDGVGASLLADPEEIERLLRAAAEAAGATPIGASFHHFGAAAGVTGVVLLMESHLSIHTWPEHGFAALDIFMCGAARPELAADYIEARLGATGRRLRVLERGGGV